MARPTRYSGLMGSAGQVVGGPALGAVGNLSIRLALALSVFHRHDFFIRPVKMKGE